jgi:hypothetical protein
MDRELGHVPRIRLGVACGAIALIAAACGGAATAGATTAPDSLCADVVDVAIEAGADGAFRVDVTVSSDDVGWEAFADRWEVVTNGVVVAERVLTHPHVDEQPFTRSLGGVELPDGSITIRAHHSTGGFCGAELVLDR